ncbi:DUF393 domain-containing protein [Paenibacillus oenotherae]|uniref:DUF393 domain-containing protein n=1 Tax=Paenibacillus oenotherae TaxID=1435645 RepID=A0ABS7D8H8_9BACL|nr:DUF393 domain-containing protein [Paenibacillus oenotherae]MBW7476240.1 DUF393 domain-containing protein [Paenibacillus oenotherae]
MDHLSATAKGERLYVLYDGTCNLCMASVRRLKELRSTAELHYIPVQSLQDGANVVPAVIGKTQEELLSKIHVVDGEGNVWAGADGVVRIIRTVRGLRWLAPLYRIPGMGRIADRLYRYIAARRYEWFGKTDEGCHNGACRLPDQHLNNKTD